MSRITVFKREWLKNVVIIKHPMTKVELEVTSNVTEKNRINATEPGKSDKYIASLKAVALDKYDRLLELFKDRAEVPIEETNGIFLTGTIWLNDGDKAPSLPMKGEKILANVDFVENREGDQVLRVTNIMLQAPVQAEKFDYASVFESVQTGAEVEQNVSA